MKFEASDRAKLLKIGVLSLLDLALVLPKGFEDTTIAPRQFARRQLTWFRADPRVHWLDALSPTLADEALATILQK